MEAQPKLGNANLHSCFAALPSGTAGRDPELSKEP